jgi:hypothetical protein
MEAGIAQRPGREVIRQISVYADNKVGRLNELLQRFRAYGVTVLAISQIDSTEFAIVRCVVDYPERAREMLWKFGCAYLETEVLAVEIDSPDDLCAVTCGLTEAEINVHYLYPMIVRPHGKYGLIIHLEDTELGSSVLASRGIRVLDHRDLAR